MALNLSSSLEDYLEAMLNLADTEGKIRLTDISKDLKVEKSSVNSAIKKLQNLKLVIHEKYGDIQLTKTGEQEAKRVRNRHLLLCEFLSDFLGIKPKIAERDACRIEHVLSCETFTRIASFVEFINASPYFNKEKWRDSFELYLKDGSNAENKDIH